MLTSLSDILIQKLAYCFFIFLITYIVSSVLQKSVDLIVVGVKKRVTSEVTLARTRTIRNLLKNTINALLFFIAILMIISQWGVDTRPILTGAGVLGLAFSFGAQTLVKDLISGFFIIAENMFNIGDVVKIGSEKGVVERINLRMTMLRDKDGNLVYIPNSQVTSVVRYKKEKPVSPIIKTTRHAPISSRAKY